MIDPTLSTQVRWYKDEAKNQILADQSDRVRAAANFVRRTARKAAGQLGPSVTVSVHVAGPDGKVRKQLVERTFTASSEPGDPPYRREGKLQSSIGYDFQKKTASWTASATIGIAAHGWEAGTNPKRPGVKRPTLAPIFEACKPYINDIIAGRTAAPQTGPLGSAANRKPRRVNQTWEERGQTWTRSTLTYGQR